MYKEVAYNRINMTDQTKRKNVINLVLWNSYIFYDKCGK